MGNIRLILVDQRTYITHPPRMEVIAIKHAHHHARELREEDIELIKYEEEYVKRRHQAVVRDRAN